MAKNIFSGLFGKKKDKADAGDLTAETAVDRAAQQDDQPTDRDAVKPAPDPADAPPDIAPQALSEAVETAPAVAGRDATPTAHIDAPPVIAAQPEPAAATDAADASAEIAAKPSNDAEKKGWFSRLSAGLSKSSEKLTSGVTAIFTKKKLDEETLDELTDLLISADLGVAAANRVTDRLAKEKFDREITAVEIKQALAEEVAETLRPFEKPLTLDAGRKPEVILMVGVNGAGKTTTIGKLAEQFRRSGKSVLLAAGDTFRAAAIEQLSVWGERTGAGVVAKEIGADAAGLAFDALTQARKDGVDVLMIDTAGRLQNKAALMDELAKIVRVIRKIDATAPHHVMLVLDATVGQNALSQAEAFAKTAGVSGIVMTKLDGTARGGVLVALTEKFGLPIHFVGVGEKADDLQPFSATHFARALAGL